MSHIRTRLIQYGSRAFALLTGFALTTLTSTAFASFSVPLYKVEPKLNGLNIKYYVRASPIKITLNVINHTEKDVLCDAQYKSGPQTYNAKEIKIGSEQADSFIFRYGRKTEKVKIHLKCIPQKPSEKNSQPDSPDKKPTDTAPADTLKTTTLIQIPDEKSASPTIDNPDYQL